MPHVKLSARAQSDLARLHTFLADQDANAAGRAMLVIREAFMPLTHAPMIGRPVEDSDGLRELVIDFGASGYLALYRFERLLDAVVILAVKHQREVVQISEAIRTSVRDGSTTGLRPNTNRRINTRRWIWVSRSSGPKPSTT